MRKAIKRLFDWTPSDIRAWEKIRRPGRRHFVLWYGVTGFGLILFLLTGGVRIMLWVQTSVLEPALAPVSFASLLFQLTFDAIVCLSGGLVTGLLTWWLEDGIYQKITKPIS